MTPQQRQQMELWGFAPTHGGPPTYADVLNWAAKGAVHWQYACTNFFGGSASQCKEPPKVKAPSTSTYVWAAVDGTTNMLGLALLPITCVLEDMCGSAMVNEGQDLLSAEATNDLAGLMEGDSPMASVLLGSGCSFTADTKVLMANGSTKPIGNVALGDKVKSTDPTSDKTTAEPVTALHRNDDTDMADLTIKTSGGRLATLHTTQNHPFWDQTRHAWVAVAYLQPGDQLFALQGTATVVSVDSFTSPHVMYNLTVNLTHTYYVIAGSTSVLVHNEGGDPVPPFVNGQDFEWTLRTPNGNVGILAETTVNGTDVTLSDVVVYGDSAALSRGSLGLGQVMGALRGTIAPAAADQGFTSLTITGTRLTGPVGHPVNIRLDLSGYGTGGAC